MKLKEKCEKKDTQTTEHRRDTALKSFCVETSRGEHGGWRQRGNVRGRGRNNGRNEKRERKAEVVGGETRNEKRRLWVPGDDGRNIR